MQLDLHTPETADHIQELQHAVLYFFDKDSNKIPVNIIKDAKFVSEKIIEFQLSSFPETLSSYNLQAAELYFYKKGLTYSIILSGVAYLVRSEPLTMQFKILYSELTGKVPSKSLVQLTGLLNNTGLLLKRMFSAMF